MNVMSKKNALKIWGWWFVCVLMGVLFERLQRLHRLRRIFKKILKQL